MLFFINFVLQDFKNDKSEIVVADDFNCSADSFLENIGLIMSADIFIHNKVKVSDDLYIDDLGCTLKCENRNVYS